MLSKNTAIKVGQWNVAADRCGDDGTGKHTPASGDPSREQLIKIVLQIQRADYEGNRSALEAPA